jgi:ABC-type transport system involved in multi-copper enzyme maturation permease subunit
MFAIARSLVWKEWREQRWLVGSVTAILLIVAILLTDGRIELLSEAASLAITFVLPFLTMFVAMNAAAGEQANRTIGLIQALPQSLSKPAFAKLIGAIFTLAAPVLALGVFISLTKTLILSTSLPLRTLDGLMIAFVRGAWGSPIGLWVGLTITIFGSVSLFLWVAAFGVNQSDEIRAGALGGLVSASVWAIYYMLAWFMFNLRYDALNLPFMQLIAAAAPGGCMFVESRDYTDWWATFGPRLIVAILVHTALAYWFVTRYGRSGGRVKPADSSLVADNSRVWLAPPRKSPFRALCWKQLRESAPLGLMGGALIGVLALVVFTRMGTKSDEFLQFLAIFWIFVANFIAIVAGIGAFLEETQPGLNGFWRSRPIKLGRYFAMKYAGGLTITVVTLGVIPLVIAAAIIAFTQAEFQLPNDWNELLPIITLLPIGLYTAAVAAILLVRQPVYAAIIAIAAAILTAWPSAWVAKQSGSSYFATMLVIVTIAAVLILAYHAFRNDWGWRK